MSKTTTLPKKGQIAFAEYIVGGKVKKIVNLGTVTKATKKSFHCKTEDGKTVERFYSFGASTGLRLIGFKNATQSSEITEEE